MKTPARWTGGLRHARRLCLVGQDRLFQDSTALVQLRVGKVERRQQAQHRTVRAIDEQTALETLLHERRAVHRQLDADHHTADANFLDQRATLPQAIEVLAETVADFLTT